MDNKDTPQIDFFGTCLNHKLTVYVRLVPDLQALHIDALSMSWEGMLASDWWNWRSLIVSLF